MSDRQTVPRFLCFPGPTQPHTGAWAQGRPGTAARQWPTPRRGRPRPRRRLVTVKGKEGSNPSAHRLTTLGLQVGDVNFRWVAYGRRSLKDGGQESDLRVFFGAYISLVSRPWVAYTRRLLSKIGAYRWVHRSVGSILQVKPPGETCARLEPGGDRGFEDNHNLD